MAPAMLSNATLAVVHWQIASVVCKQMLVNLCQFTPAEPKAQFGRNAPPGSGFWTYAILEMLLGDR